VSEVLMKKGFVISDIHYAVEYENDAFSFYVDPVKSKITHLYQDDLIYDFESVPWPDKEYKDLPIKMSLKDACIQVPSAISASL